MERRITPLNQERLRMLDDAHANNTSISLRDIISCFIKPTLKLLDCGEQKRYFVQLVGRILAEQDGPEKEVFHRHMGPVLPPFISSIQELKPHLSMRTIVWGLHFNIGATTHCIRLFCNPKIFLTPDSVVDLETMEKMLIDFVTSGLETTYA